MLRPKNPGKTFSVVTETLKTMNQRYKRHRRLLLQRRCSEATSPHPQLRWTGSEEDFGFKASKLHLVLSELYKRLGFKVEGLLVSGWFENQVRS